jgi:hypothetical protein
MSEEQFEKMYQKRRREEEHVSATQKAEKLISKLPDDLQEQAQTYFDKIV